MIQVYPGVNATTATEFKKQLKVAEALSPVVHVDIEDGKFVKRKTVTLRTLKDKTDHRLIVHYMGEDPLKQVPKLPDNTWQYVFHYETVGDTFHYILKACKEYKIKPVLAVNPATNVSAVKEMLHSLEYAHVMTVEPGKSGQKLMIGALRKIKLMLRHNPRLKISIDGGVNTDTAKMVRLYPLHSVAVTSAIFDAKDPARAYARLKRALN